MSGTKVLPATILALTLFLGASAHAQLNTEFKITKVEPAFQESPNINAGGYTKRGPRAKQWLEVEVTFDWQPRMKDPKYTDELTFTYYILLNNPSKDAPKGTLLVGTVTHSSIPQEKDMHSVAYVSPRALERFFDGKVPANAQQAVIDVGVTISKQGQLVAESSFKSKTGAWWPQFQQTPGYVLNKSETPFAPLAWDYYEAIKSKAGGL